MLVRLEGVPAAVYVASDDHLRSLLRELSLIRIGLTTETPSDDVPLPVLVLIEELASAEAATTARARVAAEAALAAGQDTFALEVDADADSVDLADRLVELLDHADRLCAEDHLLTLPATPEVTALRRTLAQRVRAAVLGSEDA